MKPIQIIIIILIAVAFFGYKSFFVGSTTGLDSFVKKMIPKAERQITTLNDNLQKGRFYQVNNLKKYIEYLQQNHPEHNAIANEFLKETVVNAPSVLDFKQRLENVKRTSPINQDTVAELESILVGTDPEIFDQSFVDLLNTVSDLTGQIMPRSYLSDPTSTAQTDIYKDGAGAHLVGNEKYGSWQGDGESRTWVWKAALAGTALYTAYRFRQWSTRRGWSYYNDTGRGLFGSRSSRLFSKSYNPVKNKLFRPAALARKVQSSSCRSRSISRTTSRQRNCSRGYFYNSYNSSHRRSSRFRSRGVFRGK